MTPRGFLLDTNVLSELLRKRPDPGVVSRAHSVAAARLKTSAMCVAELRAGTSAVAHGAQLWERIVKNLLGRVTVIPIGQLEAEAAGDFLGRGRAGGQPVGVPDALIAATAAANGLVLVTRNVRHFERLPVEVESWWSSR